MKTREQIEELKANWMSDPSWDIEETDGFEDHKGELLAFAEHANAWWAIDARIKDIDDEIADLVARQGKLSSERSRLSDARVFIRHPLRPGERPAKGGA